MSEPVAYLAVHVRLEKDELVDKLPGGHAGFSVSRQDGKFQYFELSVVPDKFPVGGPAGPLVADALLTIQGSSAVFIYENVVQRDSSDGLAKPRFHHPDHNWRDSHAIPLNQTQLNAIDTYVARMKQLEYEGRLAYHALNREGTLNCTEFVKGALTAAGITHDGPRFDPKGLPDAIAKHEMADMRDVPQSVRERLLHADPDRPLDEKSGLTPLGAALRLGLDDVAAVLISRGAELPDARTPKGPSSELLEAQKDRGR